MLAYAGDFLEELEKAKVCAIKLLSQKSLLVTVSLKVTLLTEQQDALMSRPQHEGLFFLC